MINEAQQTEDRFRQLYYEAPIAYHEIDCQGIVRSVNNAECKLFGYRAEDMIGKPVWTFVAGSDRENAREGVLRKLAREKELVSFHRQCVRSDGTPIWLDIHECLILSPEGAVLGIRSALLDITEQRRAELELRVSSTWMHTTLRCIGDGVIATDALGTVKFMNPVSEQMTGWKENLACGQPFERVCQIVGERGGGKDPGSESSRLIDQTLYHGTVSDWSGRRMLRSKDGVCTPASLTLSPISNHLGQIIGTVLVLRNADR